MFKMTPMNTVTNSSVLFTQDFTLDFYFRQFWTDPRLAFRKRPGVETLSVGSEFIKNIWVPDTFFVNEKQSYFHVATTSNEFIRVHHSGSITRSIRSVELAWFLANLYVMADNLHEELGIVNYRSGLLGCAIWRRFSLKWVMCYLNSI